MSAERLLPRYTIDDYQHWRGDWELWNGFAIAMSPSPFGRHQAVLSRLHFALGVAIEKSGCSAEAIVELDWIISDDTVVRPDVIIVCGDPPERHLQSPPGLAAEVLSESTKQNDLNFKRDLYESQGVSTYLILDPDLNRVTRLRLQADGGYESTDHHEQVTVQVCDDCILSIDVAKLFR
ncbi:Uma2 family endonuclease [Neorhodopirellula pilleata]|uniref:Putative restriction endonuclease domain-containing protein n=1 Tax=Neorhodopirellula pilleata TaxID=2714738 RepID=A0A5C5ZRM0_9BACT|nr:Uma2 family endonuclease [Neorhodopirellula pilleata]TWT89557.1 hypothetical protein Pla100_54860 [Neorhodopirellula pilleata]